MQEVEEYRKYLRKIGKKNHVVDDLIRRCDIFADFLHKRKKLHVDEANKEDILAFFDAIKDEKSSTGNYLRAIGLCFKFKSKSELSALASNLRRQKYLRPEVLLKLETLEKSTLNMRTD